MSEMKDSGIKWTEQIPVNWKVRRLKYILRERNEKNSPVKTTEILSLTVNQGVIPHSEKEGGGNRPKEDLSAYKLAYPDDIVLNSMNVLSGSVDLSKYYGCVSPVYYMLYSDDENIDIRFYNYMFKTRAFQRSLMGLGNGILIKESENGTLNTIRMRIPMEKLNNLYFPVPSIIEQRKIVEFLDMSIPEVDTIISKTRKSIEEYKSYRNSIISEKIIFGMDSSVSLKDSGVDWCPQIPEHWNIINPKVLFSLRKEKAKEGDRQLTASQKKGIMYQDEYMESEGVRVVVVQKDFDILKHVEPDDFVISMRSFQGGLEYSELSGCISSAYVMLIPDRDKVYSPFYKWFFKSSKYINAIQSTSNLVRDGQAMRYSNFAQVPLIDIPLSEQIEIANYLEAKCGEIDALIAKKEAFVEEMESYKQSLIYEYVTGKKEVL